MILRTKGCMLHGSIYMKFYNRQVFFVCLFCREKMRTVVDYSGGQGLTRKGGVLYLPNDLVINVYIFVKVSACAFKICIFIACIKCNHVHFTLKGKKN